MSVISYKMYLIKHCFAIINSIFKIMLYFLFLVQLQQLTLLVYDNIKYESYIWLKTMVFFD